MFELKFQIENEYNRLRSMTLEEFKTEVVKKARMFVDELIKVNNAFKDSIAANEINGFIDEILKDQYI